MRLPDQEQVMTEVREMAEAARPTTIPTPPQKSDGLISPIHMAPAHEGVPFEYILHVHMQDCQSCGCTEMWGEFFAHFGYRSRMGGSTVKHLRRTDKPIYNLPVRKIELPHTQVPFCSECETFDLSHLPGPPEAAKLTDAPEALMRGGKPMYGKKEEPKPKKPSLKSTDISDLV